MKQKIIQYPIRSIREYIHFWSGVFGLTDTEVDVLAAFVEFHLQIVYAKLQINAFSTDGRKIIAERLGKGDHTILNHYIKALKDKGAIRQITGGYEIDERLVYKGEHELLIKLKS